MNFFLRQTAKQETHVELTKVNPPLNELAHYSIFEELATNNT